MEKRDLVSNWATVATYQTMLTPSKIKSIMKIKDDSELEESVINAEKSEKEHEDSKKVKAVLPSGVGLKIDVFA